MRNAPSHRLPNWLLGVVMAILIAIGSFLGFTKRFPWTDKFEVQAVFSSVQTVRVSTPVRIAGVNVGKVAEIDLANAPAAGSTGTGSPAVRMTLELEDEALPLAEDATFTIRPRLFLDGNYFIDVSPGSPSAPKIEEGHVFGIEQTAHSVQLDSILSTLQTDVRANLRTLLDQLGNALVSHGGARGLNQSYRSAGPAYRYSAQAAEAQLGTEPRDLRGVIRGLGKVLGGLSRNEEALRDLITNLRTVSGSFAAHDRQLGRAIELLPDFLAEGEPTFQALNRALPPVRAFAREALPGVEKSPEALRRSLPLLVELRGLMARSELRGLVARLRPTVPELTQLARGNTDLFARQRAFSSCFNEVIIPWSHSTVVPVPGDQYPLEVGGRTFETAGYSITGSASESRSGDAAGQHLRVLGGSGSNLVRFPASAERDAVFGLTPFPLLGALPRLTDSAKTVYRPEIPCEEQEPPNLEAGIGSPPAQEPAPASASGDLDLASGPAADRLRAIVAAMDDLGALAGRPGGAAAIERLQEKVDRLGFPEIDLAAVAEEAG